ncbi:MAG TPA: hypothetical protein VF669_17895 [Tepidisphaeraceae bacterium]|jgi:hypothetical protein
MNYDEKREHVWGWEAPNHVHPQMFTPRMTGSKRRESDLSLPGGADPTTAPPTSDDDQNGNHD